MKNLIIWASGIITVILAVYMTLPLFDTDFNRFVKATIRDFGHKSEDQLVTDAVLEYLKKREITDSVEFFQANMQTEDFIDEADPNWGKKGLVWVSPEFAIPSEVKSLRSFSSKYFDYTVSHYKLFVRIYELRTGELIVHARIYLNSL